MLSSIAEAVGPALLIRTEFCMLVGVLPFAFSADRQEDHLLL